MLKKFKTVKYEIKSDKLKQQGFRAAVISDLHNVEFGEKNQRLLQKLEEEQPDMLLLAGDMVLGKKEASVRAAYDFLRQAVKIAPVFYGLGNHEQRMKQKPEVFGRDYLLFEKQIQRLGVIMLENATKAYEIKGEKLLLSGLMLPYSYYDKRGKKKLEKRDINRLVGKSSREWFHILLTHTPKYGDAYLDWGGDLILAGHYHGGVMRLPFLGGVISPDFRLFPKYCRGHFQKEESHLVVSAGLGEHTIPLRIFNPRELLLIDCLPKSRG